MDFADALASQNTHAQLELLHKIKGACYAVAAYNTADVVHQAEAAHGRGEPLSPADLLAHLQRVEVELQVIVWDGAQFKRGSHERFTHNGNIWTSQTVTEQPDVQR